MVQILNFKMKNGQYYFLTRNLFEIFVVLYILHIIFGSLKIKYFRRI